MTPQGTRQPNLEVSIIIQGNGESRSETYTTVNEESFKPTHTLMNEGFEFGGIPGDNTTIKPHIHPTLALRRLDLFLKGSNGGGGRDGIQRHINDGSDASKGGRLSAGIEAFPFSAAGFIQMDMSIDQAGEQNVGRIVGIGRPHGEFSRWDDRVEYGGDLAGATRDNYGGGSQTAGNDGARRGYDGDGVHGGHGGRCEV